MHESQHQIIKFRIIYFIVLSPNKKKRCGHNVIFKQSSVIPWRCIVSRSRSEYIRLGNRDLIMKPIITCDWTQWQKQKVFMSETTFDFLQNSFFFGVTLPLLIILSTLLLFDKPSPFINKIAFTLRIAWHDCNSTFLFHNKKHLDFLLNVPIYMTFWMILCAFLWVLWFNSR